MVQYQQSEMEKINLRNCGENYITDYFKYGRMS